MNNNIEVGTDPRPREGAESDPGSCSCGHGEHAADERVAVNERVDGCCGGPAVADAPTTNSARGCCG